MLDKWNRKLRTKRCHKYYVNRQDEDVPYQIFPRKLTELKGTFVLQEKLGIESQAII